MKKKGILFVLIFIFSSLLINVNAQGNQSKPLSKNEAKKWFNKKEWLGGVQLKPHESINVQEFANQYQRNKEYWDKAFTFLKNNDLQKLPKGKYPIDGDNVYATITEDSTKDFDKTHFESHRKYIDFQYVIDGEEKIGVFPVAKATVTKPYDDAKDVANYTAEGKIYTAAPGTFFIFFPTEAHRPGITAGGNKPDKKLVIKILYAE